MKSRMLAVLSWLRRSWPALLSVVSLIVTAHLLTVVKTLRVPVHKYGAMLRETTLTAGSGISTAESDLSNGQAQWTVTNTSPGGGGATSVTGGTGITASPTTGAVVVSLQTPVTAPNGGSGVVSPTAHDPLIGEGSGAFASVNPGTVVGVPLTSNGTSADPSFSFCTAAGGCTGVASPTAHTVPVAEGPSAFNFVSCATGKVLTGAGGSTDPACNSIDLSGTNTSLSGLLTHSNGGTDVSTPGNNGSILESNGTNWTIANHIGLLSLNIDTSYFTGSCTLSSSSVSNCGATTVTPTGTTAIFSVSWGCAISSGSGQIQYGSANGSTSSIVTCSDTVSLQASLSQQRFARFCRLSSLTAGTAITIDFNATSNTATPPSPTCETEGYVLY